MTIDESISVVEFLIAAYPNAKVTEKTIELYTQFLHFVPYELGQAAALKLIVNKTFFPTIAELKEAIQNLAPPKDGPPTPEEAWGEVRRQLDIYKAPTWSHPAIEKAVRDIGMRNMCNSYSPGTDREHFFRIYETYRRRDVDRVENESIRELTTSIIGQIGNADKKKC